MIYVIVLPVILGTLGLYYFLFKDLNYFKKHGIPHMTPLPIIGNLGSIIIRRQSVAEFVKSMYNLHVDAKYIGLYDMTKPLIIIRDPELIKFVTLKHFDKFMDRMNFINENQDPFFGKNLVVLRGNRWREVRSILTPAFTSSKMKSMFKLMSDCSVDFSNYLVQLPREKRTIEMKDIFTRYTNDVIATCAFGVNVDSMRNPENDFYTYGKEVTVINILFFLKIYIFRSMPWLAQIIRLKVVQKKISNFFRDMVETTIKIRNEKNIVRPDMLQLMIDIRNKDGKTELTIDDMVAQAFVFFFGGFDSSSTLMCFAAHEIALNQNIQEKLQNEIDQVLENNTGLYEALYEAVNNMEYLDAVISETLRMYPSGIVFDRLCMKDFELPSTLPGIKPFTIKKGQGVWIPVYGLHHDPKYFKEPERFDPERFLGERKKDTLNCGAYLPFGLGPRKCIGNRFALLETKILLFHLLARCELKPCVKTSKMPMKMAKDGFTLKPKDGFWLDVIPRKNIHHSLAANVVNGKL